MKNTERKILATLLKEAMPTRSEKKQAISLFEKIHKYVKEKWNRETALMGSVAKDTFVRNDRDLDVFLFFHPEESREKLEEEALRIGEDVFTHFKGSWEKEYAEHPYTKGIITNYIVEIVPCYKFRSLRKIQSAVDRTPFHTTWVNATLDQKTKNQVRLFKKWLKGKKLYGSSLSVEGFSGYLCEILLAQYGTVERLLENTNSWPRKHFLDPGTAWKPVSTLPDELRKRFENDALVVRDPTDPSRNVAAALSEENYNRFLLEAFRARKSIETPKKPLPPIVRRGTLITLITKRPILNQEILYPKTQRLMRKFANTLTAEDFIVELKKYAITDSEVMISFLLRHNRLPDLKKHQGPTMDVTDDHIARFLQKHPDARIEERSLITWITRKHKKAKSLLKSLIKQKDFHLQNQKATWTVLSIPQLKRNRIRWTTLKKTIDRP